MLPGAAAGLVDGCFTSPRLMRQLQLPKTVKLIDHCPMILSLRAELCHTSPPHVRVDRDLLMDAVTHKQHRAPFVHRLEEKLADSEAETLETDARTYTGCGLEHLA